MSKIKKEEKNNNMKKISNLIIILILSIFLFGCNKNELVTNTIYLDEAFSVVPYVKIETDKSFYEEKKDKIYEDLSKIVTDLDDKFNVNKENSMISFVNKYSGIEKVECDEEFIKVLKMAIEVSDETSTENEKSKYDVTIYPVWKKWDFMNNYYVIENFHDAPLKEEIDSLLEVVDYKQIEIESNTVFLQKLGAKIELGSIVKGYASDKIASYLLDCGVNNAIINVGGNILTIGHPTKENEVSNWNIAITTPFYSELRDLLDEDDYSSSTYIGYFKAIEDKETVVTSGTYERYIMNREGIMYHHILDPSTGYPIDNNLTSISIIGNISSMKADALSTALFGMGLEKALDFVREKDYSCILITKDKKIYISKKIKENFVINEVIYKAGYEVIFDE